VLIAGQLIAPFGLLPTVIGYGALILAGATAGLAAQRLAARRLAHRATAGPGLREGRTS
jgi:hypothetical protein